MATKTMADAVAEFPKIKKGWDELNSNYRTWLIAWVSPHLLIQHYLDVEYEEDGVADKYGKMIEQGRISKECATLRYAVETMTGTNRFFSKDPVPPNKYKPIASAAGDQYVIDLFKLSYPLGNAFQSLKETERDWLMERHNPNELYGAFLCGVEQYELGILRDNGPFENINAAQLARGVWFIYDVWMHSTIKPV